MSIYGVKSQKRGKENSLCQTIDDVNRSGVMITNFLHKVECHEKAMILSDALLIMIQYSHSYDGINCGMFACRWNVMTTPPTVTMNHGKTNQFKIITFSYYQEQT